MGEEAEALPGLSGVNLELHTGAPPIPRAWPSRWLEEAPWSDGRGAAGSRPQLRARLDRQGGQETRGNRGPKEQEKGQKGVPFLNFKEFYFCF